MPLDGSRDVPVSVIPRLVFDAPLDPATVGSDAFRLHSGELRPGGTVSYSVVRRSITFTPSSSLRPRLAYRAALADGVRGIDGAAPDAPLAIVFVTGNADLGRPAAPPEPTFAGDVGPLLEERCAPCHAGDRPAARLALWPPETLGAAAERRSDEWPGWAILAPGSPEDSYLLYKVAGSPGLVGERMPPGGPPPTLDEALALEIWIDRGARR